ncbi:Non-motile and phage-resistance protein [Aquisphaera giovannonii]|uniref:histidine kinase n=1 Tax=Aquisphaera giovannonii TaxID=406548 RepID=A0A5B9WET2_9BACT|nr:PAS domain S-box protein [Aquisphaera giovannonii]QEH39092.1 Non-motile and phage-resistance protein [Aquisphaera giovannonii]
MDRQDGQTGPLAPGARPPAWRRSLPLQVALGYAAIALIWSLASIVVLTWSRARGPRLSALAAGAWIGFSAFTSAVLYAGLRELLRRIEASRRELEAGERRLRTLFDKLADPLFLADERGRLLEVNPRACESLGRSRDELLAMEVVDFDAGLTRWEIEALAAESAGQPDRVHTFETRHRRADGTIFPVEVRAIPVEWDGRLRYLSLARDLTARKRAEAAIRESEERLRAFVEHAPAALAMFDAGLRYLAASRRWRETYGLDGREFLGLCHYDLLPELPERCREHHRRALAGEVVRCEAELIPDASGRDRWDRWEVRPWHAEGGDVAGILIFVEDITGRMRAERALRESEGRFRSVVESAPAGILAVDGDGRITLANRRILDWFGYGRDEILGRPVEDLVPEGSRARHEALRRGYASAPDRRTMGAGRPLTAARKDGSEFPVEVGLTLVPGAEPAFLAMIVDVTERRRAESLIRESLTFRETLLEAIPAPVFYKDAAGRYLGGNAAFFQFLGRGREETIGRTAAEIVPGELGTLHSEMDRRLLENPGRQVYEAATAGAGDEAAAVIFHKAAIPGEDGRPIGIVGVILDVTALRRAESALRELNAGLERRVEERTAELAELAGILDASTDLIATAGPDGEARWANRAMERAVGPHGPGRAIGRIADTHPPASAARVLEEGLPAAARDGHWLGETEVLGRDGRLIPVSQLILAHRGPGGEVAYYSTIMRDITERKRMEAELARAARLKDEFLAGMSHELRTPLNAVLGLAEALMEGIYGPMNDRQAEALGDVHRSGRHLLGLINEILDLSRIEAGQMELLPGPASPEAIGGDSLRMVRDEARRKRLETRLTLRGVPDVLVLDGRRVRQILVNLLSNAVKFTPEGGSVSLEMSADAAGRELILSVRDTGIGIAPEHLGQLFQPFRQLDARLSRQFGGAGLGLSLVRKLAQLHGGDVEVQSEPGRGSVFTVRLPLVLPEDPEEEGPAEDRPAAP